LVIGVALAIVAIGCSGGETAAAPKTGEEPGEAGKKNQAQGMSADQIQVTSAGANADKMTGSKAGGGN